MQKIYLARQAFQSIRLSQYIGRLKNLVGVSGVFIFLITSCSNHQTKSTPQKVEFYESKARHYQKLSDLQRLSPPYFISANKGIPSIGNKNHKHAAYFRDVRRYKKLAEKAREELHQDSNRTVEKQN